MITCSELDHQVIYEAASFISVPSDYSTNKKGKQIASQMQFKATEST